VEGPRATAASDPGLRSAVGEGKGAQSKKAMRNRQDASWAKAAARAVDEKAEAARNEQAAMMEELHRLEMDEATRPRQVAAEAARISKLQRPEQPEVAARSQRKQEERTWPSTWGVRVPGHIPRRQEGSKQPATRPRSRRARSARGKRLQTTEAYNAARQDKSVSRNQAEVRVLEAVAAPAVINSVEHASSWRSTWGVRVRARQPARVGAAPQPEARKMAAATVNTRREVPQPAVSGTPVVSAEEPMAPRTTGDTVYNLLCTP
jgi:hypothetical protein